MGSNYFGLGAFLLLLFLSICISQCLGYHSSESMKRSATSNFRPWINPGNKHRVDGNKFSSQDENPESIRRMINARHGGAIRPHISHQQERTQLSHQEEFLGSYQPMESRQDGPLGDHSENTQGGPQETHQNKNKGFGRFKEFSRFSSGRVGAPSRYKNRMRTVKEEIKNADRVKNSEYKPSLYRTGAYQQGRGKSISNAEKRTFG